MLDRQFSHWWIFLIYTQKLPYREKLSNKNKGHCVNKRTKKQKYVSHYEWKYSKYKKKFT